MIPKFPNFVKLDRLYRDEWNRLVSPYLPYSDYNFFSAWSYDISETCKFTLLNGNLVVLFSDYLTREYFYSFLGNNKVLETIEQIIKLSIDEGIKPSLRLVPTHLTNRQIVKVSKRYKLVEDRDNYDYILSIPDLVTLRGSNFEKKRHAVNQFSNLYPNVKVREIDLKNLKIQSMIFDIINEWARNKNIPYEEFEVETKALERLLRLELGNNFINLGLFDKEKLIGYSIEEVVHKNYAIAHFGKANQSYKGIYEYLEHAHAKILYKNGCRFLNYEQDLGISGLRLAKLSWRPVFFLKKYQIELI